MVASLEELYNAAGDGRFYPKATDRSTVVRVAADGVLHTFGEDSPLKALQGHLAVLTPRASSIDPSCRGPGLNRINKWMGECTTGGIGKTGGNLRLVVDGEDIR
jgi:hypothetical protein